MWVAGQVLGSPTRSLLCGATGSRLTCIGSWAPVKAPLTFQQGRPTDAHSRVLRQALTFHLATYSHENWVFPAANGGFLRGDNFRGRIWTPGTIAAGVASRDEAFTFHELHHTTAAFMIDEGADPLHVMR